MQFDIVTIGDFRFPGGTSTSIASETAILAKAGYKIGLISTAGSVLKYPHPINPEIRAVLDKGYAGLIPQGQYAEARLCLLHHPQVFQQWPLQPWNIKADKTLLITHHPLLDGEEAPFYDWTKTDIVVQDMFGDVSWAPVGPKVRAQFTRVANPPPLHPQDWTNVLEIDDWRLPRDGFMGARPVVGRHSRPDPLKWPEDRETFLQAYPPDRQFDVKLMGFGPELSDVIGHTPENWVTLPFNAMPPKDFLASLDFFVYFHHPRWVEAYGRSILEAMATGAVTILPPHFEPLFGRGAIYAEAKDVAETLKSLHTDPQKYVAQSARGVAVAKEIAGPDVLINRVSQLIGPPAKSKKLAKPATVRRPKIMFFTSNGVGMGHLTRSLAVARRLPDSVEPVFLTLSKAFGLVQREGIHAEYLPFHKATGTHNEEWNIHLGQEIREALAFHKPTTFVFDGNVPYGGMLQAFAEFPAIWKVWMRRGMWSPGSGEDIIPREAAFQAVIEPRDIADKWDKGVTQKFTSKTYPVAPIRYLRSSEMLSREAARKEIGLPETGLAVLMQLGSGNNYDMSRIRSHILARLLAEPNLHIVSADWLIGERTADLPDKIIRLQEYPLSRLFNAFDFSIGAAGYNSFHEVINAGLPTLFVPNQSPEQDEQIVRARYATLKGLARVAPSSDLHQANAGLADLLDTDIRTKIRDTCLDFTHTNGASEAARYLAELSLTRRQIDEF